MQGILSMCPLNMSNLKHTDIETIDSSGMCGGSHEGTKALRAKVPKWNRINRDHMGSKDIEKPMELWERNMDMRVKMKAAASDPRYKSKIQKAQRWRLLISLAKHNNHPKLELPGPWKPPCRHCPLSLGEGKSSQLFVSHGDKTSHGRDEEYSGGITL